MIRFVSPENLSNLPLNLVLFARNYRQEDIVRPQGLSFYQWFYCCRGQGEFTAEGQSSLIAEGDGLLIYPYIGHNYRGLTDDFTLDFISFDGSLCRELLGQLNMGRSGIYQLSRTDVFANHLQIFEEIYSRDMEGKGLAYSKECYDFLLDLSWAIKYLDPSDKIGENETVKKSIEFMEENYQADISLDDIAGHVGLTKEYLCRVFKAELNRTVVQQLHDIRLNRAQFYLIHYPLVSSAEIAGICGFKSASYFGKVFKREVGMTPEQFRRRNR